MKLIIGDVRCRVAMRRCNGTHGIRSVWKTVTNQVKSKMKTETPIYETDYW